VIVRRAQTLPASPEEIWRVVSDPHRLPAWWPGVTRVEDASPEAWTKVLLSPGGKAVRADYTRLEADPPLHLKWRHELDESPFERLLHSSTTEIDLSAADAGETLVRIAVEHRPRGWARLSPFQMRAATAKQVQGALDGLDELLGGQEPG
jgi:uncharacterized protein YndB with AHSA1/START domain